MCVLTIYTGFDDAHKLSINLLLYFPLCEAACETNHPHVLLVLDQEFKTIKLEPLILN